jgi:hypothetical protein
MLFSISIFGLINNLDSFFLFVSVLNLFQDTLEHKMRLLKLHSNKTNQESVERRFLFDWNPQLNQVNLINNCMYDSTSNLTGESCVDIYFNKTNVIDMKNTPILISLDQNDTKGKNFILKKITSTVRINSIRYYQK